MTKRESILQSIVTALAGTTGVGNRIYRDRQQAVTRDEVPAIIVRADIENPLQDVSNFTEKKLTVVVEVYHRGVNVETLADPVVESLHNKIMADVSLGGLAIDISEAGTTFELDDADQDALILSVRYEIWYRHQRNNLAS